MNDFSSISLDSEKGFSWVFLVDWILTVILVASFVFYTSRGLAYFLSCILEWLLWKKAKIKVNFESFRISLLGGRIFFKNLTIIDKDYTISFLEGRITWKYWLTRIRKSEFIEELNNDNGSMERNSKFPSRFILECEGLEIFIYNKTASYDNIIKTFSKEERTKFEKFLNEQNMYSDHSSSESTGTEENKFYDGEETITSDPFLTDSQSEETAQQTNDRVFQEQVTEKNSILQSLPFQVRANHASAVFGNKFTPTLMIVNVDSAQGIIDYAQPKEKLDLYKMKMTIETKNLTVSMKQNIGYSEEIALKFKITTGKISKLWKRFNKVTKLITKPLGIKKRKHKHHPDREFQQKWKGLSLYKDYMFDTGNNDLDDIEFDFAGHEYAKYSIIAKCPKATFTYEFDVPGYVPHGAHPTLSQIDGPDVGNNGAPPSLGLDIQLFGGSICYGPWAQRQMSHIQTMMSPVVSRTQKATKRLTPGSRRIYTMFNLSVIIMEDTTWRIPTREPSKDADFLKHYRETNEDYRPFGWIDLKFSKDTTASFCFELCPTIEGTKNNINIRLNDTEIRTSVNHDIFMKCTHFDFDLSLGYPLGWNDKAIWTINMTSSQLESFLLREHITLVADTLSDFSSGEAPAYELFRPFEYLINWKINGYSIYLNVNDHNIVNNPLDFNENCYLSFHGDALSINLSVPKETIGARSTTIDYSISTPMFRLLLNSPPWNTLNEFMKQKEVGRSYDFKVTGSYLIYNDLDVDNVDTIIIECTSRSTALYCYGYVIRYLFNVKMNYFGDFFHFVTSEEYTGKISDNQYNANNQFSDNFDYGSSQNGAHIKGKGLEEKEASITPNDIKRMTNETDLWLTFHVTEGALLLPETIYNCDPITAMHFAELMIDVRSSNYYMDLLATFDDICLKRYISKQTNDVFEEIHKSNIGGEEGCGSISDISIHGHRMYGLPPTEPTYFCKWDFHLGSTEIDSEVDFIKGFFTSFQKIGFGYNDLENVLLYEKDIVDDMTSVTANIEQLHIIIHDPEKHSRVELSLSDLRFQTIDFENEKFSTRMDAKVPSLQLSVFGLDEDSQEATFFEFETQLKFTNFCKYKDFEDHKKLQIEYITQNDAPFHRCSFILPEEKQNSEVYKILHGSIVPSSSLPPLPIPIVEETINFIVEDLLGEYEMVENTVLFNPIYTGAATPSHEIVFHHNNDDFDPLESTISKSSFTYECESDNYIIDINYISININPKVYEYIESLLIQFYSDDVEQIIDSIEIGIVKRLSNLQEGVSTINNIKLRILTLDMFYGERTTGGIELFLYTVDFEMNERTIEKDREKTLAEVTMLMKTKSIRATINERYSTGVNEELPPALSLMVETLEFWSTTAEKQVNSVDVNSTDITIDETQLPWLFKFFNEHRELIETMIRTCEDVQNDRTLSRKELISRLTTASEYYQISHDPYVLTKPAFIMRLSRGHVRENRSWKIITRLRHIMSYLPDDWNPNVTKCLKERKFDLSQNAKNIFMSVFSTWRNWEFSDIARSYIYGKLFSVNQAEKQKKAMGKIIKTKLASVYITIYTAGHGVDHNFIVSDSNLVLERTPQYTDQGIPREKIINITGSLGNMKGKISDKMFKIKSLMTLLKKEEEPALKRISSIQKSFQVNLVATFQKCDLLFAFGKTDLGIIILDGKASLLLENSKESIRETGSLVLYTKRTEISLRHRQKMLIETQITDLSTSFAGEALAKRPNFLVNLQCDDIHFRMMPETNTVATFVREFLEKWDEIKDNLTFSEPTPPKETNMLETIANMNADISVFFSNVSLELMPLTPLQFRQETKRLQILFNSQRTQSLDINVWDSDIYLGSHLTKQQYLRLSLGNVSVKAYSSFRKNMLVNVELSASIVKLTFSEPHRLLYSFLQDERVASTNLKMLSSIRKLLLPNPSEEPTNRVNKTIQWTLDTNIKYFGILVPVSTTFFIFELHSYAASLANMEVDKNVGELAEISGSVAIDNILMLVKDRSIPSSISKLVDFSLKISTIQKAAESHNSFQIESPHFRISLSPYSLVRLIWGGHQILALYQYYRVHHSNNLWTFLDEGNETDKKVPEEPLFTSFKLSSCHILSYNFCIGWLFQNNDVSEPGLILGYNRLFSAYEKGYGKLTVVDAFFAVAKGSTANNFYSDGNEKESHNRSYLPNLQIIYWMKNAGRMRDVFIRLHGEALDVDFLSTFIKVIESTLQSIQVFQDLKKILILPLNSRSNSDVKVEEEEEDSGPINIAPFLSDIRMVNCQFQYDGGIFKVFSHEDIESNSEPSFEIKSPGVTIDLDYKNDEKEIRPHWIRGLISINSTHNILYSRCAPLLMDFAKDIQKMVKKHSSKTKNDQTTPFSRSSGQTIDYKRLLSAFDIALKIGSSEQKLSLSCEPKAKVQADVGFNSFTFGIATNDLDVTEPLSFSLIVEKMQASVRHVFSREASTSFDLDLLDLTFMFTHPDIINMFAAGLISDINVYFNVKQLQNLYLFLDIWKLSDILRSQPMKQTNENSVNSSTGLLTQARESKSLIPWCFTLIFANIKGIADLGPSLGVTSINLQRAWFASDHYEDMRQLLHLFIDEVKLESKGRLSGIFEVEGASWIAEVNWPNISEISKHPLVALSLNINDVSVKAAFDYHMFLIGTIHNTKIHLHSERDKTGKMPDLLVVTLTCQLIDMCSTALVAANLYDIYNTIMRMRQDTNISYLETLRESNTADSKENVSYSNILQMLNLIQTDVTVDISTFNIQISPISLFDLEVLVVKIESISAGVKTLAGEKLATYLDLQLYNAKGSLSTSKEEMDEDKVAKISVDDYMTYASNISGGTIIDIPKLSISMHTWQKENSDILEYTFNSAFGDKISVKWNLGPVNFIKEMWATHVKALAVRRSQTTTGTIHGDEDIEKRIKEEENLSKLTYIALEDPKVDMPQIKDLGDATPPLEWFGVNRKRFPLFAHQTVMIPIQKLIQTAENEYASIVGHSQ